MKRQLTPIVSGILFQKKIESILLEYANTPRRLVEVEGGDEFGPEEKKAMDQIVATFTKEIQKAAPEIKATARDEEEIEKIKDEHPELEELDKKVNEEITVGLVLGIVAAVPKILEIFGYLSKGVGNLLGRFGFKKGEQKAKQFAHKLLHAGHKVHEAYIGGIQKALQMAVPDFKTLEDKKQKQIAELIFMVIVMYLGLGAGVEAANAYSHLDLVHGTVEGALAAIKAGELSAFIGNTVAKTV